LPGVQRRESALTEGTSFFLANRRDTVSIRREDSSWAVSRTSVEGLGKEAMPLSRAAANSHVSLSPTPRGNFPAAYAAARERHSRRS